MRQRIPLNNEMGLNASARPSSPSPSIYPSTIAPSNDGPTQQTQDPAPVLAVSIAGDYRHSFTSHGQGCRCFYFPRLAHGCLGLFQRHSFPERWQCLLPGPSGRGSEPESPLGRLQTQPVLWDPASTPQLGLDRPHVVWNSGLLWHR